MYMGGEGWGGELKCYIQTYRPSNEVGSRGVFAPKRHIIFHNYIQYIESPLRASLYEIPCACQEDLIKQNSLAD